MRGASLPDGPDLEAQVRRAVGGLADAPEDRPGDDLRALLERLDRHVVALEAVDLGEVALERREVRLGVEDLLLAAVLEGHGALGLGEEALLAGRRGGRPDRPGDLRRRLAGRLAAGGGGRLGGGVTLGQLELARDLVLRDRPLLRDGVGRGGLLEVRVGVRVAVHVAELDEVPQPLALADADDLAVLHRDGRRARLGEDVDPPAVAAGLDGPGGVRALGDLAAGVLGRHRAGVAGGGVDGEVALGQAGQRADQVGGQPADEPRPHEHGVDVPVRVVVGEDRLADVRVGVGGLEVAGGGEDRVDRVEGVLRPVVVGVDAVGLHVAGMNCIQPSAPALETLRLRPVVRLDLVDRARISQRTPYSMPAAW
jgi:hypothetical protein